MMIVNQEEEEAWSVCSNIQNTLARWSILYLPSPSTHCVSVLTSC